MSHYVLDACALVNLYCGWGGLTELQTFGVSWSIGDIALKEALFVRDFDAQGGVRKVTLDPTSVITDGNLQVLSLSNAREHASLVEFALDLDDGEAQALSLAQHRQLVLVTDDRPALRAAVAPRVAVQTLETPDVLMAWVAAHAHGQSRLPEVIRRISILGPFQLKKSARHYGWWHDFLASD